MKIVVAPDSFKESLTAMQVAGAIADGIRPALPEAECDLRPVADGGEGTVDAIVSAVGGQIHHTTVMDPLGRTVPSFFALLPDNKTAIIEVAAASGLHFVRPEHRSPLNATSYGSGQLVKAALDAGARKLIIGLGGSATNDAGAGLLEALGFRLLNKGGQPIGRGGAALAQLERIDTLRLDPRLKQTELLVACDVTNPLCGPEGASHVFGAQKGASQEDILKLDKNLLHFAEIVSRDLQRDIAHVSGAGAAGGMGAALLGVLNAHMYAGFDIIAQITNLEETISSADLVITGEGRLDSQSIFGKTPVGVARLAQKHGVPVIAIAGSIETDLQTLSPYGFSALFSVNPRLCSLETALQNAEDNIRACSRNIASAYALGMKQLASKECRF
ncbi:glycerate kinase [Flexibacterium corallicola]|uniref:glycerate kinase n=1 Tax=Flexibacterium corallicola TaxID=3037259 RepID=UPI00286EFE55|nr:glycerate kinase [Pseudovibrio sp. M1P-2-3]